jgi:flavin reductase
MQKAGLPRPGMNAVCKTGEFEPANRGSFLRAMGRLYTGVSVVATDGPAGRFALTVSATNSVSADPPTLLVCIRRQSPINAAIRQNRAFCVNMLANDQRVISETFAGRADRGRCYDFGLAEWRTHTTGSPLLAGAVAAFDCTLKSAHEAGSHTIFLGDVIGVCENEADPLLYGRRSYGRPSESSP